MIQFDGQVMDVRTSKDGLTQYVQVADREQFARYSVNLSSSQPVAKGDVVSLQVLTIRSFKDSITLDCSLLPARSSAAAK